MWVLRKYQFLILLLTLMLISCEKSLKETKWATSINKEEINMVMNKIAKVDTSFHLLYDDFVNGLRRKRSRIESLYDRQLMYGFYYSSCHDLEQKTGILHPYPMAEFISDKKMCIIDENDTHAITRKYYEYKYEHPLLEIYKMYNNKKVVYLNGRVIGDDKMLLTNELNGEEYAVLSKLVRDSLKIR